MTCGEGGEAEIGGGRNGFLVFELTEDTWFEQRRDACEAVHGAMPMFLELWTKIEGLHALESRFLQGI